MPPRKSNVSQASGAGDEGTPAKEKSNGINIEDLALPRTMVQRLAKGVLPPNTQIQKDAITAFSKSATVFVNYLSNAANDRAILANRKTISPANVLEALADVELEIFLPRVEAELRRFNEIQTGKRNEYRRKLKEGKEVKEGTDSKTLKKDKEPGGPKEEDNSDEGEERAAKRVRRSSRDFFEAGPHDQLVERPRGKEPNKSVDGTDETIDDEDTIEAAEDDVDEQEEEGGDDSEEEDDDEDDDEDGDEEEEEEEERDEVADMDSRLRKLQAGMSSSGSSRAPSPTSSYSQDGDDSD